VTRKVARAILLTAHVHLAVWPNCKAWKLFKRLRQGTVFITRLVE
jgi:hypothetical protein